MSVVVWDGKTLAADRQGTSNGLALKQTKLRRFDTSKGPQAVAWVGTIGAGLTLLEWWRDGEKKEDWPKELQSSEDWARLIVVEPSGECYFFENVPHRIPNEQTPMAWGSGRDFAMGALAHGANAVEAVEIATRLCTGCGYGVDSVEVRGA